MTYRCLYTAYAICAALVAAYLIIFHTAAVALVVALIALQKGA